MGESADWASRHSIRTWPVSPRIPISTSVQFMASAPPGRTVLNGTPRAESIAAGNSACPLFSAIDLPASNTASGAASAGWDTSAVTRPDTICPNPTLHETRPWMSMICRPSLTPSRADPLHTVPRASRRRSLPCDCSQSPTHAAGARATTVSATAIAAASARPAANDREVMPVYSTVFLPARDFEDGLGIHHGADRTPRDAGGGDP